ncbi:MAG: hypothetical protein COT18_08050 [Elusimicrobia bacterium CG08_land_8_20_14_0_20_59_10]|nr:MAG: hypothetical protein COT18_08050 [Elusimicrobia bacterium CG08_land_8_20_14_0_20_59_10]
MTTGLILPADKVRREWKNCRRDWDKVVCESGDENGKYVLQGHHWEEPCFDPDSLAGDLEPIAARMRPLIRRVFKANLDPGFKFAEVIEWTVDEIGSGLPEWLDPFRMDGLGLGPETTACLLEWEWLVAQRDGTGAFAFVDKLRELEASARNLELHAKTVAGFISRLSVKDRAGTLRGILGCKDELRWKEALESPHSGWFGVYQRLCRLEDPARYLESCRVNIPEDWKLALPVARNLLARRAFEDAIRISGEGLRSFLNLRTGQTWDPKEVLLAGHREYRYREPDNCQAVGLLDAWRKAARALGEDETACALGLQAALCREWADWDASLGAFEDVPPGFSGLADRLFAQWRGLVADASLGPASRQGASGMRNWIHALADAARSGGSEAFHRSVKGWFGETEKTPARLRGVFGALATLTMDLDDGRALRQASRQVYRLVSRRPGGDRRLGGSRRRWLRRLKGRDLPADLFAFWKRNFARMLPDPGDAMGSNYSRCVEWLAALREFAPQAYAGTVRRWAVTHRSRRNLWTALREKGLPVG